MRCGAGVGRHTWAGVLVLFQGFPTRCFAISEVFGGSCPGMLERCNRLALETDPRAHRRPGRLEAECGRKAYAAAQCALRGSSEEIRRDCPDQNSEPPSLFPGPYGSPPIPRRSSSFFRLKPTTNSPSTNVAGVEKTSSFSRSANADSSSPMFRSMNGISC